MAIKNLLVSYSDSEASDSALRLALMMARKYDAHLTGILAHSPTSSMTSSVGWLSDSVIAQIKEREQDRCAGIAQKFADAVEEFDRGDMSCFLDISGEVDTQLSEIVRCHDLLVAGQFDPLGDNEKWAGHPDQIALQSGRPVLVVPAGYTVEVLGARAVVAWDGKRAAARALGDAMQILETKAQVTVVTIGKAPEKSMNLPNVMTHLARHGIAVERRYVDRKGRIGQTLLTACNAADAGLLVMGAYEHSKFSEHIIGGVTQDILKEAKLPVLISH